MQEAEISIIIDIVLLALLCVSAIFVVMVTNLLTATIVFSIFSLLMASMYLVLGAPDVAITEAAIGAGMSTVLLLAALMLTGEKEKKVKRPVLPLAVIGFTAAALIYATMGMPAFGDANAVANTHVAAYYIDKTYDEIGIPNLVTAILASYRGYDTLGETFVIFTAGISVLLILGGRKSPKKKV